MQSTLYHLLINKISHKGFEVLWKGGTKMFFKNLKARSLAKRAVWVGYVMGEEIMNSHTKQDGPYFFGPDYIYEDSKILVYIFGGEEDSEGGYYPATIQVYTKEYDQNWLVLNVSDGYVRHLAKRGPYVGKFASVDVYRQNKQWETYLTLLARGAMTEFFQTA